MASKLQSKLLKGVYRNRGTLFTTIFNDLGT
jgi:hypothetical protein